MCNNKILLFLFFSIISFSACEVINPAEPVPAYLKIDSLHLQTDYNTQGSATSSFTDVWVVVNNTYLGTYEYPGTYPVIGDGAAKISLRAGIVVNGVNSNRAPYLKVLPYDTTVQLGSNQTINLQARFNYLPGTIFAQLEDFDDASISLVSNGGSSAQLNITSSGDPDAFENNSGSVLLDENHSYFEVASSDTFQLLHTVPVFIELNYKCESEFSIGLYVNTAAGVVDYPLVGVRASSVWKKIYVNATELNGVVPEGLAYKVYLRAQKPGNFNSSRIFFDNLKVLY